MPRLPYRLTAWGIAGAALTAAPAAASAAEQASATGDVRIEQSVGASLEIDLLNQLLVQIYLPGSSGSRISLEPPRAPHGAEPQLVGPWAMAAVSLNIQQLGTAPASGDGNRRKELIVILAQFN